MFPFPQVAGAALGFLGGQDQGAPEMTDQQRRLYREWLRLMNREEQFSRSAPLSQTFERQGLADSLGLFGQAARRSNEAQFAGMSPTALQSPSVARARSNVASANTAQQGGIIGGAMQQALARRDASRQSLPGYLQGAGSLANNPGIPGQQGGGMQGLFPLLQQAGMAYGMRQGGGSGMQQPFDPTYGTQVTSGFNQGARGGVSYY